MTRSLGAIFVALVWPLCTVVNAQTNFQPGLIEKEAGKKTQGFIDHKEWTHNPESISFKENKEDPTAVELKASDLLSFEVEDEHYLTYRGPISMDRNIPNPKQLDSVKFSSGIYFLKVIATGDRVTLYRYRDKIKTRFLFQIGKTKPEELIFRYRPSDTQDFNSLQLDDRYKYQLRAAANTTGQMSKKVQFLIKKSTYANSSLISITDEINGDTKRKMKTSSGKSGLNFFVGGGLMISQLKFSDGTGWDAHAPSGQSGFFATGIDIAANPNVGKLIFRAELSFSTNPIVIDATHTIYGAKLHYSTSMTTVSVAPVFIYNIYNSKDLKIYAGGGITFNSSKLKSSEFMGYGGNSFGETSYWFSEHVQAGVTIHQKLELYFAYKPQLGGFIANDFLGQSLNTSRLGLHYHFIKRTK